MLNFAARVNEWNPPELTWGIKEQCLEEARNSGREKFLAIFKVVPYIDAMLVYADGNMVRFTFNDDYCWNYDDEMLFEKECLMDYNCGYTYAAMMSIYKLYSNAYPEWRLKRYHNKGLRLLDHIYNCMRKNTAKEILYKAGLDELAIHINEIDELDLLASSPMQIYSGVAARALRSLNCEYGARLLSNQNNRKFIIELHKRFPDLFRTQFNDAQCRYLEFLIVGDLTVNEVGRLFGVRYKKLAGMWNIVQFRDFIAQEQEKLQLEQLSRIDWIYKKYLANMRGQELAQLKEYLLFKREEYDKKVRQSTRRHESDWQERDSQYVIRYPQTINDFCREAVYMSNCLLTYVEPYLYGDTIILLMRRADDVNRPFITVEIFHNRLEQAFRRFNEPIHEEDAVWLREYCNRHGIDDSWLYDYYF